MTLAMGLTAFSLLAPSAFAWDDIAPELYHMCSQCHGAHGEGNQAVGAPVIQGLPEWYLQAQLTKFRNGARGAHPKDINGLRMRPMARALTESNIKVMAQYISSLPRLATPDTVKGSLVKGESRYQVCQACHGPKGDGNQALNAPPLAGASDWYLVTQLRNFKNHVRGYDPQADAPGMSMQGMAATLDDAGIMDVVAYINTLKPAK